MTREISIKLSKKLLENRLLSDETYENFVFGFEVLLISIIQTIGLIIFGILTRSFIEILSFLIFFTILRSYAGGVHADSCLDCFLITVISYYVSLNLSIMFTSYEIIFYIILFVSAVLLYLYAPIDNPNKKFNNNEKQKYRKLTFIIALIFYIILILAFILTNYNTYCYLGAFSIFYEALTLLPFLNKLNLRRR